MIKVYASPQHEYTPLKKEEIYSDDVTCSDATIYCTSDYTSKIQVLCTFKSRLYRNSFHNL